MKRHMKRDIRGGADGPVLSWADVDFRSRCRAEVNNTASGPPQEGRSDMPNCCMRECGSYIDICIETLRLENPVDYVHKGATPNPFRMKMFLPSIYIYAFILPNEK